MSPVVLVILIAWALLSVVFLTGTLLAARSIDRSVSGVTHRTLPDGKPEPNIYTDVQQIHGEAAFIDEARKTVAISTAIRKAAEPLSGHLARTLVIADKGIGPKLKSILGKVGTINATATEINGSARSILGSLSAILARVKHIDGSVNTVVVNQATPILAQTGKILPDFDGILANVGVPNGGATVTGHANGIDCSTLLLGSQSCNK